MVFIWVLVSLFILAVMLMAAVQPATIALKRENEQDLIFRGEEYTEAIRLYQSEHGGTFPTRLEDLMKVGPKQHRYIRRLYRNPFDPDGKWGLLAPGSTVVTTDQNGRTVYIPQGGTATPQRGAPPAPPQGGPGTAPPTGTGPGQGLQGRQKILPFRLDGKEGQPILGVYCPRDEKAFSDYRGAQRYNEWFFSPLVIPPPVLPGKPQGPPQQPGKQPPPQTK
ncbi:MAG: type II secretion system protein [Acidobacteriota bacterium]